MMVHKMKVPTIIIVALLVAVFLLSATFSARGQFRRIRLSWPKNEGAYIAKSSATIPAFPRTLSGYRSVNNRGIESIGSLRVFEGQGWETIYEFPYTQNRCSAGAFMIRWRVANPNVRVASAIGYSTDNISARARASSYGYMYGTNCEQPMFMFVENLKNDGGNLIDIYYELKFWQAAP